MESTINDLQQAKEYFHSMGCSHFHMSREDPALYKQYRSMNVPGETEINWRKESLSNKALHLLKEEPKDLWSIHSGMECLVQELKNVEALEVIFKSTKEIEKKLPPRGKLLVAETINGRQSLHQRSGLIFLAHSFGRNEMALELAEISLRLSEGAISRLTSEIDRCKKAAETTIEIIAFLNLK